jgi:hypothetical protein
LQIFLLLTLILLRRQLFGEEWWELGMDEQRHEHLRESFWIISTKNGGMVQTQRIIVGNQDFYFQAQMVGEWLTA